jgi:hypothetical protein
MITCSGHSTSQNNKHFYTDYFPRKNRHLFLLVEFWDDHPALDAIYHAILERIVEFETHQIPPEQLPAAIEDFFQKLNWQTFSLFQQAEADIRPARIAEKGASLLFVLTVGADVFVAQFGRLLCARLGAYGTHDPRQLADDQFIGSPWRNFAVKSKDDMNLLGYRGEDIGVRVAKLRLDRGEALLALSSAPAQRLLESGVSRAGLPYFLQVQSHEEGFSYLLLEGEKPAHNTRRRFWEGKRFRISALVIVILMVTSYWYFHRGKNVIVDTAAQTGEQLREIATNPEILTDPAREMKLRAAWSIPLPSDSVAALAYDQSSIFAALPREVLAIDRSNRQIAWRGAMPALRFEVLDSNRLLAHLRGGRMVCLRRSNGEPMWNRSESSREFTTATIGPIQISRFDDRRLANSFTLIAEKNRLVAVNFMTNKELARLELPSEIRLVSDFDPIAKSVFVIAGNRLTRIDFDIEQ